MNTRTAAAPEITVCISECWIVLRTSGRVTGTACTGLTGCCTAAWAGGADFAACIMLARTHWAGSSRHRKFKRNLQSVHGWVLCALGL